MYKTVIQFAREVRKSTASYDSVEIATIAAQKTVERFKNNGVTCSILSIENDGQINTYKPSSVNVSYGSTFNSKKLHPVHVADGTWVFSCPCQGTPLNVILDIPTCKRKY